jgi:hypothetical protein
MYMRVIFSLLVMLLTTAVDAAPFKPSVAYQIRHPRGQQVAGGNCTTTCQWIGGRQICNTYCF